MKRRLFIALSAVVWLGLVPTLSWAAMLPTDEAYHHDARLEGYTSLPDSELGTGTMSTWFLLIFLAVVGLSVCFKSARRTHLD